MHEASLAMNIFDILRDEMKKYPDSRLHKVFIDIGEFTHIDPETLEFAFEVMAQESEFGEAKLEIKKIPLLLCCGDCGDEFSARDMLFQCPKCKSRKVSVLKGREFRITQLEVD